MSTTLAKVARFVLTRLYPFPRGQGRIVDRTFLSRIPFEEGTTTVRTLEGIRLAVMPNDHIGRHLFLTGQFDRTIVEVLQRFAMPNDQMLDIGANIGYVSCLMLHGVPGLRVVSVEPLEACHALLRRNLAQFGARAACEKVAISDHTGEGVMAVHETNTGASALQGDGGEVEGGEQVTVLTAEELVARHGLEQINLIKIDVEGHEERVIASLAPLLGRFRPRAIVFEHHGGCLPRDHSIRTTLTGAGYRIHGIHKRLTRFELVDLDSLPDQHEMGFNDLVAVLRP